jgi:hypothetical protein
MREYLGVSNRRRSANVGGDVRTHSVELMRAEVVVQEVVWALALLEVVWDRRLKRRVKIASSNLESYL